MELPSHVRVVSLHTTNFKRIRAVEVTPDPTASVVLVGGEIDNGKSSLLDSLLDVIIGSKASPDMPVRKGMQKSETVVDLGALKARVRHTRAGGRELQIEDAEGNRLKKPQEIMDALSGMVGFDAEDFIRRKPAEQLEILRKIVGIDFAPLDAKKATLYTQRTAANSVVKTLETQLASAPNPTDAPAELVDTTAVLAEIQKAQDHNKGVEPLREAYTKAVADHNNADILLRGAESAQTNIKRAISSLEEQLGLARIELERADKDVADHREKIGVTFAAKEKAAADGRAFVGQDTTTLQAKLAGADAANNKFRQAAARKKLAEDLKAAEAKAAALDNQVQQVDADKEALLLAAKFPVNGLSLGENGIYFDGVPFDQAASSTKRRVSVAIGAALNPKLRVCIIKDGALLGQKGVEQVRELAREFNLQVWIEMVTNSKEDEERCTVVIEDGMVKGAPVPEDTPEVQEKATSVGDPVSMAAIGAIAVAKEHATPPKDLFGDLPPQ
jgi:hypothetical protein